ncbi:hypothetical protein [Amycolatopsis sp. 195334CR]|uniref:hypothetical protein n=1 Tax=Amycolatopsis sp. 195334CR TaxID=2814588 RepID=UPI001A8D6E15|nr:hypothetical protein [Amycolatopsis sp. 195334CR]MBN6037626.1 hypothetical protein [Amycolatopsis sp. 195334CR]
MTGSTGFNTQSDAEAQGGAPPPPPPPPAAGDAGNSFLDSLFAVDPWTTSRSSSSVLTPSGSRTWPPLAQQAAVFALEPEAGQKFVNAVTHYVDEVWPSLRSDVMELAEYPELGSGPYVAKVAEHDRSVMDGDDAALIPNFGYARKRLNNFVGSDTDGHSGLL